MRWIIAVLLIIVILATAILLIGCKNNDRDEEGGTEVTYDKNAPTKIESTELVSFECDISTITVVGVEEKELEYGRYYFKCKLDDGTGKVTGTYGFHAQYDYSDVKEYPFETDAGFMQDLNNIIIDSKIISDNGKHSHTNGIPEEFGYSFKAIYASGEKIACSDNQSNDLSLDTIKKLSDLFLTVCKIEE